MPCFIAEKCTFTEKNKNIHYIENFRRMTILTNSNRKEILTKPKRKQGFSFRKLILLKKLRNFVIVGGKNFKNAKVGVGRKKFGNHCSKRLLYQNK